MAPSPKGTSRRQLHGAQRPEAAASGPSFGDDPRASGTAREAPSLGVQRAPAYSRFGPGQGVLAVGRPRRPRVQARQPTGRIETCHRPRLTDGGWKGAGAVTCPQPAAPAPRSRSGADMLSSGRCFYCRRLMYPAGSPEVRSDPDCQQTRDHMIPRSLNRQRLDVPNNIGACCNGCNNIKGNAPPEVFLFWVRQPLVVGHGREMRRAEFRRFCYGLMLAGFKAARRDVLNRRPPAPRSVFTFAASPVQQAQNDAEEPAWMKGKVRVDRGRFARKETI